MLIKNILIIGNFEKLKKFFKFYRKTPSFGKSLVCIDNNNLKKLLTKCKTRNYQTYDLMVNQTIKLQMLEKKLVIRF